jgi:hypothetical protein
MFKFCDVPSVKCMVKANHDTAERDPPLPDPVGVGVGVAPGDSVGVVEFDPELPLNPLKKLAMSAFISAKRPVPTVMIVLLKTIKPMSTIAPTISSTPKLLLAMFFYFLNFYEFSILQSFRYSAVTFCLRILI